MVDRSHKGRVFPSFSMTVERGKLREFLLATGDDNPVYQADDPPLPPTFPAVFLFWGSGGLEDALRQIGVEIWNVLHAEQEYEYLAPIHVGDTVIGTTRVEDIYARGSGEGALEFVEFVTDYVNQAGETVVRDRALIIVREHGTP